MTRLSQSLLITAFICVFILGVFVGIFANEPDSIVVCPEINNSMSEQEVHAFKEIYHAVLNQNLSCDCPDCPDYSIDVLPENSCYSEFETIAYDMARQHNYDFNDYNCVEFADSLANRYRELGWNARVKSVHVDCSSDEWSDWVDCERYNGGHRIVRVKDVFIEATSGRVIRPEEYNDFGVNR